jgi:3-oxoacyl-[acyl-carrier-protein] synthase II
MSGALKNGSLLSGAVITGAGLVTPLGSSLGELSAALRDGTCALRRDAELGRHLPDEPGITAGERAVWAARIGEFGAAAAIDAGRRRRMPRLGQMAVVAAQRALGLSAGAPAAAADVVQRYGADRVAVVLGTGLGTIEMTVEFEKSYIEGGAGAASPAVFPYTVMNTPAALVAMELGLLGANQTVNHRDLSFCEALAAATELLECGRADAVLAGGCDELGPWLVHGLLRLGALAQGGAGALEQLAPSPPMHPYDRRRSGLLLGEGAVLVLLERPEAAAARQAPVLARVAGVGRGGDERPRLGWGRPGEPPAVEGAAAAIRQALAQAGLAPDQIDYISGSGNGTELDRVETAALRRALGTAADTVRISSVLGQSGEWLTSAGVRLGSALLALAEQRLPGTVLCREPDPEASLPGLLCEPQAATVRSVLVPCLAQGGGSVALVLSQT